MSELAKIDGRRARGLRTRNAIVTALLDLVAEGDTSPTTQRIAARAGVSVRSVYQHFRDVEGLFCQAAARLFSWASETEVDVDPGLSLDERIEAYVRTHSEVLEAMTPFSWAARALESSSTALSESRLALVEHGRKRLASAFGPELDQLRGAARENLLSSLELVTIWPAWDHLRSSGASIRTARRVMSTALARLLAGASDGRADG